MNSREFVGALAKAAPSLESLVKEGFSKAEAEALRESYFCRERALPSSKQRGELRRLITDMDCSRVEIGMMRLDSAVSEYRGSTRVGSVEADPLVVHDGRVCVMESGTAHILWNCAKDEQSFLAALIVVAGFLARGPDLEEQEARRATAIQASRIAGGKEYVSFFEMLCGCD